MAARPYGERAYRAALAVLRLGETPCVYCGARAQSPDHVPPLADHDHTRVGECCHLVAACARCNLARGAATGNRRRRARSRSRLAPGSGSVFGARVVLDPAAVVVLSPPAGPDGPRVIGLGPDAR